MTTTIKNIHRLELADDVKQKLEAGAAQHKRYSNIEFKIIDVDDKSIVVKTTQGKHLSENYADKKTLIERTKQLFEPFVGKKVNVHATVFAPNEVTAIDSKWVKYEMEKTNARIVDLEKLTGVDKTNLSAWISGLRPMSQPVKAMFFYLFTAHLDRHKSTVKSKMQTTKR